MRKFLTVLSLVAVAAPLGVYGARITRASATSSVAFAGATNHCTRYVPATAVDVNCYLVTYNHFESFSVDFGTSSIALRDDNYIDLSGTYTSWNLYFTTNGVHFGGSSGNGTYGNSGGSGSTYAQAHCGWINYPRADYNECETDWHT